MLFLFWVKKWYNEMEVQEEVNHEGYEKFISVPDRLLLAILMMVVVILLNGLMVVI